MVACQARGAVRVRGLAWVRFGGRPDIDQQVFQSAYAFPDPLLVGPAAHRMFLERVREVGGRIL
ncbi:hypothetical protein [Streptomyces malaysiensis]|uniref:hypothetical protein n=1 Tax=Streptomyces malaysiensis TaxID=92644 RepID=UPI00371E8110